MVLSVRELRFLRKFARSGENRARVWWAEQALSQWEGSWQAGPRHATESAR